jgi:hypothetical protein
MHSRSKLMLIPPTRDGGKGEADGNANGRGGGDAAKAAATVTAAAGAGGDAHSRSMLRAMGQAAAFPFSALRVCRCPFAGPACELPSPSPCVLKLLSDGR